MGSLDIVSSMNRIRAASGSCALLSFMKIVPFQAICWRAIMS